MKIVVDLQACQSGSRLGGIGRYSMALAKAMAKIRSNHDLYIVLNDLMPQADFDIRMQFSSLIEPERIVSFSAIGPVRACQPQNAARGTIAEAMRVEFLQQLNPDIIHIASLVEGWGDDVVTSVDCESLARKTAVTWYDLIPYVQPEMYLSDPALSQHYYAKVAEAKKAGLLLAISQYSRDEAIEVLGLETDRVVNISSAVSEDFKPIPINDAKRDALKVKFGIDRPFLLYTGSFDIRKNQAGLIKAFGRLPDEIRKKYQLVICGNGWDGIYKQLRDVAKKANVPENSLIFTGRVSDEELFALYNTAHLFVFPSLREGFGLPVLEAMACGVPAIGSNCTSVPEVIGREDALFDPTNVDSISQKIFDVLANENFRQELIRHGYEHHRKFTWEASAKRALEAFEDLHDRRCATVAGSVRSYSYDKLIDVVAANAEDLTEGELRTVATSIADNESKTTLVNCSATARKPRVGVVTTWGVRCGIASYAKFLVDNSSNQVDSFIFAEESCPECDSGNVVRSWRANAQESLSLLASKVHRQNIDSLIIHFNYGFYNAAALNDFVKQQFNAGRSVTMILHATKDPDQSIVAKKLVDFLPALQHCERVLVHSKDDIENLQKIGIVENAAIFPHGIFVKNQAELPTQVKKAKRVVATYGFFLNHKGLSEIVDAFAAISKTHDDTHLLMINAEYSPAASSHLIASIKQKIERYHLQEKITMITDYLEDEVSLSHLVTADLIVFPYQVTGESSSAAIRMGLASGKPVAVTPLAIFNDVSHVTLKLPGTSPAELTIGIQELLDRIETGNDPEVLSTLQAADEWKESHDYTRVGSQLGAVMHQFSSSRIVA